MREMSRSRWSNIVPQTEWDDNGFCELPDGVDVRAEIDFRLGR
jgi:hypothetical protein